MRKNACFALGRFLAAHFHQDPGPATPQAWDRLLDGLDAELRPREAARVASELRALLAQQAADRELEHTVFTALGCGYDPRRRGTPVREWLRALLGYLEWKIQRENWGIGFDERRPPRAARLRPPAAAEVERIGAEELARRTGVPPATILEFVSGATLGHGPLDDFDFYFRGYGDHPDLRGLTMGYFFPSWDLASTPEAWEAVVDRFARAEAPGVVRGADDVRRLLATARDEDELRRVLDELGCHFAPERAALTCREWLQAVHERLRAGAR
jgi:hypothetical protein